jgi:hypothetical protein
MFLYRKKGVGNMRYAETVNLKKGDLVVINNKNKHYRGLVFEIESIDDMHKTYITGVTLKQPGFDNGFRIKNYPTGQLKRFEP